MPRMLNVPRASVGPAGDPDEAALETQLRILAVYDSDALVFWEAVSLEKT